MCVFQIFENLCQRLQSSRRTREAQWLYCNVYIYGLCMHTPCVFWDFGESVPVATNVSTRSRSWVALLQRICIWLIEMCRHWHRFSKSADFREFSPAATSLWRSVPTVSDILKSPLATAITITNDCSVDFWESSPAATSLSKDKPLTKCTCIRNSQKSARYTIYHHMVNSGFFGKNPDRIFGKNPLATLFTISNDCSANVWIFSPAATSLSKDKPNN